VLYNNFLYAFCDPENYGEDVTEADFNGTIADGLALMESCDLIVGHNWNDFDGPALEITDGWEDRVLVRDTAVLSRMIWSDLKGRDLAAKAKRGDGWLREAPAREGLKGKVMYGHHSLKAWGYRLNEHKGDHNVVGLTDCSKETLEYCKQDVIVTHKLWQLEVTRWPEIMKNVTSLLEAHKDF
jgi:DNA polymerase I